MNDKKIITITIEEYNLLLEKQKQVDELTAEKEDLYFQNQNLQSYIDNHEPIWKRNTEQAVKDTAKEIFTELLDFVNGWFEGVENNDFSVEFNRKLKDLSEKYGVEVE